MKIALIGYGKMGKEIEIIAIARGHEIVAKINKSFAIENLVQIKPDIAIEFTNPEIAVKNIEFCLSANIPVVIGSTGWYHHLNQLQALCKNQNGAMLYATNFSLGVNLFFAVNKYLAKLMNHYPEYKADIVEIHHTQKLDAPSGTAISIAEQIIEQHNAYNQWENCEEQQLKNNTSLPIVSERKPDVPGTHIVKYESAIDKIEISHTAANRKGFALGSVIAAEWLKNKKGIFTMNDVLSI